ncbi:TniB family NTP-binding protein [Rhizobium sp. 32-5/1]|uniref:TniB family NTP-binding protein n=1 Tax=Rhizobium sp. 32-5/1 TaxID=3019602 RepID=UPI00240E5767|nr:TniB family NTP-binding protein [Rhizobium sp. 32-5/1]WEZ83417.1 TniB family NTP-binding protein [Rhizobium sp. 32-5/1]
MSAEALAVADKMSVVRSQHVKMGRDETISSDIALMKASILAPGEGNKKKRMYFVTGESNSGKTRAVRHAIASDPGFESYVNANNVTVHPAIWVTVPSPCTHRNLAVRILRNAGYAVRADIPENLAWEELHNQLPSRQVLFLVLDEAQRALKIKQQDELQKLSDSLISLVDSTSWPMRVILLGVDPLGNLHHHDQQIENRSELLEIKPLTEAELKRIERWIKEVIGDHALLDWSTLAVADIARRLLYATIGNAGSIIELIRDAIESALSLGDGKSVTQSDFAQAYSDLTKCLPEENIFEVEGWDHLPSGWAKRKKKEEDENDTDPDDPDAALPQKKPTEKVVRFQSHSQAGADRENTSHDLRTEAVDNCSVSFR